MAKPTGQVAIPSRQVAEPTGLMAEPFGPRVSTSGQLTELVRRMISHAEQMQDQAVQC